MRVYQGRDANGTYQGELDEEGNACGQGILSYYTTTYEGTFFNNKMEGVIIYKGGQMVIDVSEYREGYQIGKMTYFHSDDKIVNSIQLDSQTKRVSGKAMKPDQAFYTKEGKINKATDENWKYL